MGGALVIGHQFAKFLTKVTSIQLLAAIIVHVCDGVICRIYSFFCVQLCFLAVVLIQISRGFSYKLG